MLMVKQSYLDPRSEGEAGCEQGCPNRAESRGRDSRFGQNERLGDSAIRRFGNY